MIGSGGTDRPHRRIAGGILRTMAAGERGQSGGFVEQGPVGGDNLMMKVRLELGGGSHVDGDEVGRRDDVPGG